MLDNQIDRLAEVMDRMNTRPQGWLIQQTTHLGLIFTEAEVTEIILAMTEAMIEAEVISDVGLVMLWKILASYRMPMKLFFTIEKIYDISSCCIQTEEGYISWFQVLTGVWQGYTSPFYFLLLWLTGYLSWHVRTEASHSFSTVIFLTLTLQLLQTAPNTFKTWLTQSATMQEDSIFLSMP